MWLTGDNAILVNVVRRASNEQIDDKEIELII